MKFLYIINNLGYVLNKILGFKVYKFLIIETMIILTRIQIID